MKKILFLLLIICIASCKSRKLTADSEEKFIIENIAPLSAEKLKQIFPNAEIEEGTAMFEEGTVERNYTTLFPNSENELLVTWQDVGKEEIHNIRTDKNGRWKSKTGIEIGTTYSELVKINKDSVHFYGFGWDYSGAVDYNGGKLEDTNLRVFLSPTTEPADKFYGDRIISATPEEIENLNLEVSTIIYQNPND